MEKVVLDTNVILRAVSSNSPLAIILDSLLGQKFEIVVSTEILLEYEEKIIEFYDAATASNFLNLLIVLPNV